ncbi:MAG: branched chain amino acid aminotransferase [Acidobacteria bacterium]|nr:MAG: branched chain amino acid aminotransferase [Acidobacteriota bacterium]PYQ82619.1 MAG: branched chain amino acid aminotransferase [Acidobacteriota bacterium]PYQ90981.1 MAG: branched chain amino acid aminotransferase [Acidobacteriota bacterium]PYR07390.1 MAG: branched chain amino acid aminotransferase [Acidobacteriota bacterium]PYR15282.1 MAG: branched chain amino acid aminotransferase [Acidobacteriota bacterium]
MGFTPTEKIWFNGKLVAWGDAKVHVLTHALQYGTGVFEGMRCYATPEGPAVFRLDAHLERMVKSAELYELRIPYSQDTLAEATLDVIRANKLDSAYIRPIAFFGAATLSVWTSECPVEVAIAAFATGQYLAGADKGVRVTVSSIRKFDSAAIPAWGKACGQYINSVRAVQEAQRRGFDEALLLNSHGQIAEGSGENLFLVRNGEIVTNDIDASILMGVTRASILEIAGDLGIPKRVAPISVEDVLGADELFFTGTAVEVTAIREVDGHVISEGKPGPVTRRIQETFNQAVRGELPQYRRWLAFARQTVIS